MSFRASRGGYRGGGAARGGSRGGRGGRGGRPFRDFSGPPGAVMEAGKLLHTCESLLLIRSSLQQQVPYFNGRVFLENKQEIGKVDEIMGPINNFYFSVKLNDNVRSESFNPATKFYIDQQQVLPLSRFLPQPPAQKKVAKKGKDSHSSKQRGSRGAGRPFERGRGFGGTPSRGSSFMSGRSRGFSRRGSFRGRG